jgi:hypothetical protein
MSLREFLNLISQEQYAGAGAVLDFRGDNRSFVVSVNCKSCQKPITLMRPSFRIFDQETYCQNSEACSERVNENNHQEVEAVKTTYEEFDLNSTPEALLDLSLYALGIPDFHIVSVKDIQGNYYYYELSNDKAKVLPDLCQAVAEITK